MAFLTMEVLRQHVRVRAVIREHVCPENLPFGVLLVTAHALSDVPVSYLRRVVCSQNAQRLAVRRSPSVRLAAERPA